MGPNGPCAAVKDTAVADRALDAAVRRIDSRARSARAAVRRRATRARMRAFDGLLVAAGEARAAAQDVRRADAALRSLCRRTGRSRSVKGVIASVDGDRVRLTNGLTILTGGAVLRGGTMAPGARITATAASISGAGLHDAAAIQVAVPLPIAQCGAELLVGPPQEPTGGPWLYYPLKGYTAFGIAYLQTGTAFGARLTGACGDDVDDASVDVSRLRGATEKYLGRAHGRPDSPAFVLPSDFQSKDKLVLRFHGTSCTSSGCTSKKALGDRVELPVGLQGRITVGHKGQPTTGLEAFGTTSMTGKPGSSVVTGVFAVGHVLDGQGFSSYPGSTFVDPGDTVAVHRLPGRQGASGLLWGYEFGERNGSQFFYATDVARTNTDDIARCQNESALAGVKPGQGVMRYHLPWKAGAERSVVKRKGGTTPFVLKKGEAVLAARRGEVRPKANFPGHMSVLHADGSIAFYSGVKPSAKPGDFVERGQKIGTSVRLVDVDPGWYGDEGSEPTSQLPLLFVHVFNGDAKVPTIYARDPTTLNGSSAVGWVEDECLIFSQLQVSSFKLASITRP